MADRLRGGHHDQPGVIKSPTNGDVSLRDLDNLVGNRGDIRVRSIREGRVEEVVPTLFVEAGRQPLVRESTPCWTPPKLGSRVLACSCGSGRLRGRLSY